MSSGVQSWLIIAIHPLATQVYSQFAFSCDPQRRLRKLQCEIDGNMILRAQHLVDSHNHCKLQTASKTMGPIQPLDRQDIQQPPSNLSFRPPFSPFPFIRTNICGSSRCISCKHFASHVFHQQAKIIAEPFRLCCRSRCKTHTILEKNLDRSHTLHQSPHY